MKRNSYLLLFLVIFISIGYAILSSSLTMLGNTKVMSNKWDIHFENIIIKDGSVSANVVPYSNNIDTTELNFDVNLNKPGDYYEFYADIVNKGTIDAMVNTTPVISYTGDISDNLITSVEYKTYRPQIMEKDLLEKNSFVTIKVLVFYDNDISADDLNSSDISTSFSLNIDYVQAEDANVIPTRFEADDWSTIASNIKNGSNYYAVGDTKCIPLDGKTATNDNGCSNGEYKIRIVNSSRPDVCNSEGFSQSSCGYVFEFDDVVIPALVMNPYGNYNGVWYQYGRNIGGYPASSLKGYVDGIYSLLPLDLQSVISDTTYVSSHGNEETDNIISTDKLFILDATEYSSGYSSNNSAYEFVRQLDYYASFRDPRVAYPKSYNGTLNPYWTRTAVIDTRSEFVYWFSGWSNFTTNSSNVGAGFAPAFRIE